MKISPTAILAKLNGFTAVKSFVAALSAAGISVKEDSTQSEIETAVKAALSAAAPAPAANASQAEQDLATARATIATLSTERDTNKAKADASAGKLTTLSAALAKQGITIADTFTAADVEKQFQAATTAAGAKLLADNGLLDTEALPATNAGGGSKSLAELIAENSAVADPMEKAKHYARVVDPEISRLQRERDNLDGRGYATSRILVNQSRN